MASTFNLEIITPERKFFTGEVEKVILKTIDGEIGILKNHLPLVAAVAVGVVKIFEDGEWLEAVLNEGFMEVRKNKMIILTDTAEWPHEIDINRAKAAEERARDRLHHEMSKIEHTRSQSALVRAQARLKIAQKTKRY